MGKFIAFLLVLGLGIGAWYFVAGPGKGKLGGGSYSGGQSDQASSGGHGNLPAVFADLSFEKALAENATSGKPLVVNMSASWCPPCQQMKKQVWPDPKVASWFATNGKAIYVDVDQDKAVASKLNIKSMPTMVVFKNGKEVARTSGGRGASDLISWLDKYK